MRNYLMVLGLLATSFFAFNVYRISSMAREAKTELEELQRRVVKERENIAVLRAEWAFLNRPDRLRALVESYYPQLELAQINEGNYGETQMVPIAIARLEDEGEYLEIDSDKIEAILQDIQDSAEVDWP